MTEYEERIKTKLKFSLENIWNYDSEKNPSHFRQRDGMSWLFVTYKYLTQRYCPNVSQQLVLDILNSLAREGYLTYYSVGTGDRLAFSYSLSCKQKGFIPQRSFDPDEFFRASLVKSYDCEVF